jgi:alkylation response protein AidB-like acyl-CoA dehydrogenase
MKRTYLPRFARGDLLAARSMSEADAGSNLAAPEVQGGGRRRRLRHKDQR